MERVGENDYIVLLRRSGQCSITDYFITFSAHHTYTNVIYNVLL